MKTLLMTIVCVVAFIIPVTSTGYKEETHAQISANAVKQSGLARDQGVLRRLGLEPLGRSQQFQSSSGLPKDIFELFQFGATFEDSGVRAISHFYDPLS